MTFDILCTPLHFLAVIKSLCLCQRVYLGKKGNIRRAGDGLKFSSSHQDILYASAALAVINSQFPFFSSFGILSAH